MGQEVGAGMAKAVKQKQPGSQPEKKEKRPPQVTWREQEQLTRWVEEQTPIWIKLLDGSILVGKLKWYDQYVLKLLLVGGEALTVPKHSILYYRQAREGEESQLR